MTTKPNRPQKSRRRRRTSAENALSLALFGGFAATFMSFGGVTRWAPFYAHLFFAAAMVACLSLPERFVRSGGAAVRFAMAGGILTLGILPSFLPIPGFLRSIVAPGWADRSAGHWLVSADWTISLSTLFSVLLVTSVAFATATWAGRSRSRKYGWYALYGFGAVVMLVAVFYALGNRRSWMDESLGSSGLKFFPPFINPNHFGSFLVLLFPFYMGRTLSKRDGDVPNWLGLIMAFGVVSLVVWSKSSGPLIVLVFQTVLLLRYERKIPWGVLIGVLLACLFGLTFFDELYSSGTTESLHGRIPTWRSSISLWADHWLFGSGAGTFELAFGPYRVDHTPETWHHAHNDWIEWVTDTGLVGVVAGLGCLWFLRPRVAQSGAGGRYALLGVVGLCLHAGLDFPFHILSLPMFAAVLLGWRAAIYDRAVKVPLSVYRAVAVVLLVTQVGGMAWAYRDAKLDASMAAYRYAVRGSTPHRNALLMVERWAPNAPELVIERAVVLARNQEVERANELVEEVAERYRGQARIQSTVAAYFRLTKQGAKGLPYAEAAVDRGPSDWRNWEERAKVMELADPSKAPEAWKDALLHGTPRALQHGWNVLPVGVYWVDALQNHPIATQTRLAGFLLARGDREAAYLAFENVHRLDSSFYDLEHGRLLAEFDPVRAVSHMRIAVAIEPSNQKKVELYADLLEGEKRWVEAIAQWETLATDNADARYRATRATALSGGASAALLMLNRARASGEMFSSETYFLKADLHASLGQRTECVATMTASGLLDRRRTRKRAQAALDACSVRGAPL